MPCWGTCMRGSVASTWHGRPMRPRSRATREASSCGHSPSTPGLQSGGPGSRVRVKPILLALCLLALIPGAASAAVHVDPDSPSGQEYALPLDDARGDAANGHGGGDAQSGPVGVGGGGGQSGGPPGGATSGGGEPPPAFGVGLSGRPDKGGPGGTDRTTVGGGEPRTSDGAGGSGGSIPTAVGSRTAASTSSGGFGSTLLFSGLGVGTL